MTEFAAARRTLNRLRRRHPKLMNRALQSASHLRSQVIHTTEVVEVDDELVAAFDRLTPQLSS